MQQAEIDALLGVMSEVGLHFNPQVLRRGIAYFEQGRVRFERSEDESLIVATVRGDETHTVSLRVETDTSGTRVVPQSAAGVEAAPNKYVAAAFFGHMVLEGAFDGQTALQPRDDRDVTHVLDVLASLEQSDTNTPDTARATLKFALSLEPGSAIVAVRISGRVCSRLQSGAWSRGKKLALARPLDTELPEEQLQLLDLFISLQGSLYNSRQLDCRLPPPLVATVLRRLLALGIGEIDDAGRPLVDGGVRTLEPAWVSDAGGRLGLKLGGAALGERLRLVRSDNGFWYVDRLAGRVGPVRTSLTERNVQDIMQLPLLDPDQRRLVEAQIPNICRNELVLALSAQARDAETLPGRASRAALVARSEPGRGYALHATVDYPIGSLPLQVDRERSYDPDKRRWQARDREAEIAWLRDALDHADLSLVLPDGRLLDAEDVAAHLRDTDSAPVFDTPAVFVPLHAQPPVWADHPGWVEFSTVSVPKLIEQGWRVELPDELRFERHDIVDLNVDFQQAGDAAGWFSVGLTVDVGEESIPLLPLLARWLQQHGLRTEPLEQLDDGAPVSLGVVDQRELRIPAGVLRPLVVNLADVLADVETRMQLPRAGYAQLDAVLNELPTRPWRPPAALQQLATALRANAATAERDAPPGFQAELRPYQREGLGWLTFLADTGMGGILADDMGLGKTVQTLAHVLDERQAGRLRGPVLVVTPTSVVGNWARECAAFVPSFAVVVLSGPDRKASYAALDECDIAIASYAVVQRDVDALTDQPWALVVLDEAQWVKNPGSKTARAVRELRAERKLCLSGTPVENHTGELWALFDFLMPGFLGDKETFRRLFRDPIEKQADTGALARLRRRTAPFILRRTKDVVARDLPARNEMVQRLELTSRQKALYEAVRALMESRVRDALFSRGLAGSQIMVLDALLKLRQACCDPRLLPPSYGERDAAGSAKLEHLLELVETLQAEKRSVLVFSQFASMLDLIGDALRERQIDFVSLTGRSRRREELIDRFQSGEVGVFLISLKAGGVGLNLTRADTVVLFDPWWNPAAEQQAIDRAHRIGQTQTVFVYRLIASSTVEEKILELQARKRALATGLVEQGDALPTELTEEQVIELLQPVAG
ncbi:MAG: DEAD/DEAH box helicase [Pseudomonadota bacterium]